MNLTFSIIFLIFLKQFYCDGYNRQNSTLFDTLKRSRRMIETEQADPQDCKWFAKINCPSTPGMYTCSATLISPKAFLTTATCIDSMYEGDLERCSISFPCHYNVLGHPYDEITISRVIKYPNFDSTTLFGDIAIIIVDEAIKFTDPIRFGSANNDHCFTFGKSAMISRTPLFTQEYKIVEWNECIDLRNEYIFEDTSFICARSLGQYINVLERSDRGAPLVCPEHSFSPRLMAIMSYTKSLRSALYPALFTALEPFKDWITNTIQSSGTHHRLIEYLDRLQ